MPKCSCGKTAIGNTDEGDKCIDCARVLNLEYNYMYDGEGNKIDFSFKPSRTRVGRNLVDTLSKNPYDKRDWNGE